MRRWWQEFFLNMQRVKAMRDKNKIKYGRVLVLIGGSCHAQETNDQEQPNIFLLMSNDNNIYIFKQSFGGCISDSW